VYNEIRVFVSAYVWMTGFGNFLYFDKKQDFTIERAVSMWIRINYFPLLLSASLGVAIELYYVVPLHTTGFFITMATCWIAKLLETRLYPNQKNKCNVIAIALCATVHIAFYESPAVNSLEIFSHEYFVRFQIDKYTALVGIACGFCWQWLQQYMNWCYAAIAELRADRHKQLAAMWGQRLGGVLLIAIWYVGFGYMTDKFEYNPIHPFVFWMPVFGWLMIRNSSKYLTELHSTALEFLGRITLETYVLQFHVFMCNDVQYIPIVIPGSGPDGHPAMRFLNMLVCGVGLVSLAWWARKITVTTQMTATEVVNLLVTGPPEVSTDDEEGVALTGKGSEDSNEKMLHFKQSDLADDSDSVSVRTTASSKKEDV